MALVSLGSCLFTINSVFAFLRGPMSWDASRVSAAIPSGVGFLGAGLIFKEAVKDEDGSSRHVVHGLTTAASVWLSAAVGVACGGELYFSATFCTALILVMLRFGPRMEDADSDQTVDLPPTVYGSGKESHQRSISAVTIDESPEERDMENGDELKRLINRSSNRSKTERPRQKPRFSSII